MYSVKSVQIADRPVVTYVHLASAPPHLAFTRYCHYQYCMVYSIQMGSGGGCRNVRNGRAIVLQ